MFGKSITHYLNSATFFDKENEGGSDAVDPKAAAAAERAAIQVDESSSKRPTSSEENNDENNDNEEDDDDEEEEGEEEGEEKQEEENNNDNEETDEQKTVRLAKEKEERKQARQQRKWDRLAAERDEQRRRADALEAKLKELPVDGLTEEEVERRAEEKAAKKLAAKEAELAQRQFEETIDSLEAQAVKANKNFNVELSAMVEELGMVPGEVISVLADLDNKNGGEVLNYLASNIDEAEDIFELKKSPSKLALKLIRISDKIKGDTKPVANIRRRSNVPDPIAPVGEGRNDPGNGPLTGKESMDDWVAKRNKQAEAHQRRKMGMS
jgi:hypothetical protein